MSENDDWKTFYQHLSKNLMTVRVKITGSTAELNSLMSRIESDLDVMFYYTDEIGVASSDDPPKGFQGRIIKFYEYLIYPGFVQIQQSDRDYLMTRASQFDIFTEISGPAHKMPHTIIQVNSEGSLQILDIDAVFSVFCHGWPTTARTWTTRCRPSGWPTKDVVELVVSGGYHLVEKSHPLHTGDYILWRISFSKAELRLIESWMPEQKHVYYVLRLIKQNVVKACGGSNQTVLCTYHFKTLMLWQCEKRPKEFWMNGNTCAAIVEILCEMIEWLIDKNCPNYFIPENNMLDHIHVDHNFSKEVDFLSDFLDEERLMQFVKHLNKQSVASLNVLNGIMSQNLLLFPGLIEERNDQIVVQENTEEFEYLHLALKLQVELRRSVKSEEISKMTIDSEDITEEILLREIVQDYRVSISPDKLRSQLDGLLSDSNRILLQNTVCSKYSIFLFVTYLANFYYAVKRDYARSRSLCRKVFECLNICNPLMADPSSFCNIATTELSFPMLLSTEWLDLFDDDIQTVVGFLRVYGFHTNDQNCSSDAIKICPVLFLHYVNAQCEMQMGTERKSLIKALDGFTMHFKKICPSDLHPWDVSTDQRKLRATILYSALSLRRRLLKLL